MQLSLLEPTQAITKTIKNIPLSSLELSPFNPRSTRPDDHTDKLAGRISRQGFEVTRALWVYPSGDKFLVFAGGTRLKAATIAKLAEVPCVVHEGLNEADIVRLAYQDNENDEYHAPVSIVDVWANYANLYTQKWTQQQIADAVGVTQQMVGTRLKLNNLSDKIKKFTSQGFLNEGHLAEIMNLQVDLYFSQWLTQEIIQLELCNLVVKDKLNVKDTRKLVAEWKAFIDLATKAKGMETIVLTFTSPHSEAHRPSYNETSHIVVKWLIKQAFAMLTKERGTDALMLIVDGNEVPCKQKINYSVGLANDVAKLCEGYATIKVEATGHKVGAQLGLMDMPQVSHYSNE